MPNALRTLAAPVALLIVFSGWNCQTQEGSSQYANFASLTTDGFADYWYRGEGEISTYELDINRYGEERQGHAVLVFVTEDFSRSKQVKLDQPDQTGKDKVSVLKLNALWKFTTGIYDYSMMNSVFTPVDLKKDPQTLKTTSSSQDWCGHTFLQYNLEDEQYRLRQFSYFEQEGDSDRYLETDLLEDELWNRLRLGPGSIPTGEVDLIPGSFFSRLSHEPIKPRRARIRFNENEANSQCIVEYLHLPRTIRIQFETNFPHRILSWTEENNQQVMVRASLQHTIKSPYWTRHDNDDLFLRDTLGLPN